MEEIRNYLIKEDYTFEASGKNYLVGKNNFLKFRIIFVEDENIFFVDFCLLKFFDRWNNSGYQRKFKTEKEIIAFFSEQDILKEAFKEPINELINIYMLDKKEKERIEKIFNSFFSNIENFDKSYYGY